jgi:hypothetical protein
VKLFDCPCKWRFLVGKKKVYGPIYAHDLPGHFTGPSGCHTQGRMMSREQFEDDYADCAYRFQLFGGKISLEPGDHQHRGKK